MWWENKLMRTIRCRLQQKPGVLGHLLAALGDAGGFLGEIKTVRSGIFPFGKDFGRMDWK